MSMTRDAYAKQVRQVAEAALNRNESPICPHEDCSERLEVIQAFTHRTRSVVCPVHGAIFHEQRREPYSELDWEGAEERVQQNLLESEWDESDECFAD